MPRSRHSSSPAVAKTLLVGFLLAGSLFSGLLLSGAAQAAPTRPLTAPAQAALRELAAESPGSLLVSPQPATGTVRFLRLDAAGALPVTPTRATSGDARSRAFLRQYGRVFGVGDADRDLDLVSERRDLTGGNHVSYRQVYRGVPVFGGVLRLHYDAANNLYAVNGTVVPDLGVAVRPRLRASDAASVAIGHVERRLPPGAARLRLAAPVKTLVVFRTNLVRGVPGTNHLAWQVEVVDTPRRARAGEPPSLQVREQVFVDAINGRVLDRIAGIETALSRQVSQSDSSNQVWSEGSPLPYSAGNVADNAAINRLINVSADAYHLFENLSAGSYLSYDGRSSALRTVHRASVIPSDQCPNANWDGVRANFCDTTAVDDVIVHELTHGYTQETDGLIYQWQPGALNEAYSDIFGETVDLLNGSGTDEPQGPRSDGACSTLGDARAAQVAILAPAAVAGSYAAGSAQFGPSLVSATVEDAVVQAVDDANGDGPSTTDGCSPLRNAAAVSGRIALVDRGVCTFVVKVKNAQAAGARAVIVVNNQGDDLITMAGDDASITIPAGFVRQTDGTAWKAQLANGLRARLGLAAGTDNSYRWLLAEDDAGPGASFRDMWNPGCLNHPGRTGDRNYFCSSAAPDDSNDNGGVHRNSGIANHAYALLVDGGTYNGRQIAGIGVTKAAHLYWRAKTLYQTPTSDFADHADALSQACADFAAAGTNLPSLTARQPSGQVITDADCTQLANVIAATQLASATTPCNYPPLLAQNPPALCGSATPQVFFGEDFEHGAGAWTIATESPFAGASVQRWALTSDLPELRTGSGFYAPASVPGGSCNINPPQVKHLTSPPIALPASATAPQLAFDHWLATDSRDGGNLELAKNGGAFAVIPDSAFRYNGFTATLGTSDNPLAGQRAWSGTDAASLDGSWGQTQVDLTGLARPGDRVQLRWNLGTGSCTDGDGWYLDNVRGYQCPTVTPGSCVADGDTLCLLGGRYRAEVTWTNQFNGASGHGIARPNGDFTGFFAFDDPSNIELIVKMLDFGDVIKVFYGQLTNLRFTLTITDVSTGVQRVYGNGPGDCGDIDQAAFSKRLGDAAAATGSCQPSSSRLCLLGKRFAIDVDWRNQFSGQTGSGQASSLSDLSGLFTFTDPRNVEILTKTLDFGDRILFIYGSLSDLEYTIHVTDTVGGQVKTYTNAAGNFCGQIDDHAF